MEKATVKQHFAEIDVYKGIAILLIIFGHSFCTFPVDFRGTNLINISHLLGTFNLNMFFVASGILFSTKDSWGVFMSKKIKRLLLPWLVFVVLSICFRLLASSFTNREVTSFWSEIWLSITTGKYYWFLYALFIMMLITKAIRFLPDWLLTILGGALLILAMLNIYPNTELLCVKRMEMYYPWFLLGVLVKNSYGDLRAFVSRYSKASIIVSALMLFIFLLTYHFFTNTVFIKLILPFGMCVSLWGLSIMLANYQGEKHIVISKTQTVFSYCGKYSLQYYLNHLLIILPIYYVGAFVFNYSQVISLMTIFLLAVFVSTIMLYFEKKIPYVKYFCGL